MARFITGRAAVLATLGAAGALLLAPAASADPDEPVPLPDPGVPAQVTTSDPAAAAADPGVPTQVTTSDPVPAASDVEVPHLSSPENLPPGTTNEPNTDGARLSYLRELWHAYQTQEISGGNVLLLLAQRPMSANSSPRAGVSMNPQEPLPAPPTNPEGPPPAPPE